MKKLLLVAGLAVSVLAADAAQFKAFSLLAPDVSSIICSNGIGITNLLSTYKFASSSHDTNVAHMIYSNKWGQQFLTVKTNIAVGGVTNGAYVTATGWAGAYQTIIETDNKNLLQDIPLWVPPRVAPVHSADPMYMELGGPHGTFSNAWATVTVKLVNTGSAAAGADVTLGFNVIQDGINAPNHDAQMWTFPIAGANSQAEMIVSTNIPSAFLGVGGKLRLVYIVNGNTDGNSVVWVKEVNVAGFVP